MTTVQNVLDFIEALAPLEYKMDWDHVGLNCGHADAPVNKILVALDPFEEVVAEAKALGVQLLVTHHALIWEGGFVNDQTSWGKNVMTLLENGIAHINAHTNLDCALGGVNDILAQTLELKNIHTIEGQTLLRAGDFEASLPEFLDHVKTKLGCDALRFVGGGKPVRKVAVGGGSCAGEMMDAYHAGCDTFVTADIKYNQFRTAYDLGMNIIDAGHFHTENPAMVIVAEKIRKAFPDVEVVFSQTHSDCMKFY